MAFSLNNLPKRTEKPRQNGLTLALDKGFSVRQAEDFVASASNYFDVVKLGWGTAYVTQNLEEKIEVYHNADIPVYFGGTLFEAYILRNQLDAYVKLMQNYDIKYVEVSNGTIWLSDERKQAIIKELSQEFTVYSEVGSRTQTILFPLTTGCV